jgi:hypothetical protein
MKPILFIDFDGTLCYDRFWKSVDANTFQQIQNFLFSQDKTIIRNWMRGFYSSEDINQLIAQQLHIPFKRLWKIFVDDCENMSISADALYNEPHFSDQ